MNSNLNRGERETLENRWAKALRKGKTVKVKIEPLYESTDIRPNRFMVLYYIDDKYFFYIEFYNKANKYDR
ncbi:DNA/RNA non-specific endonuclease [Gilliamella sp. B14384G15]|uniref:DNA/RNA non-specific endonuclease n=1 Tax=unclassified Gilliamella TaxID=2685620 RepID=UPI0018DDE827|nr:DNA/RNA non-specific endonuclease [Gilliamella sp. B14384G15]MBI0059530.1 DNA/RNA non-specific endonuclease [Gilliamella sp. B14384G12]